MPRTSQPALFDLFDGPCFPKSAAVLSAVESLASNSSVATRGAVFTRLDIVDFILDLSGYTDDRPLYNRRILEPAFGGGDFLLPIISRLLSSWKKSGGQPAAAVDTLGNAIRAMELHHDTFNRTRQAVIDLLVHSDVPSASADELAGQWLKQGDFLLETLSGQFDYIVGNPPYVRQELIPPPLLAEYRRRYRTMYDRADLYVPFIERSLSLLQKHGALGFICADRWMKNRYGGPLRDFVSRDFHLKTFVDMVDVDAFHSEVSSYPAITVITREEPGATRIAYRPRVNRKELQALAEELRADKITGSRVREIPDVAQGEQPWLLESADQTVLIRRLEKDFPTLEDAGCKVGIGVATGADNVYIGDFNSLDVEPDRKLPLVTTRDIRSGDVDWQGLGVINPFMENGQLADLEEYPKLAAYLNQRKDIIADRHCAKKSPHNWYRTIDRIWPDLAQTPKLLIPDIKGEAHIVFEPGKLYPHHNLYYITSNDWDLRALQAVLRSGISKLFVSTYSTKMRGGYLRFQAQYLRRIRIPPWKEVSVDLRRELIAAAENADLAACNRSACKLYNLSNEEHAALGENGREHGH